MNSFIYYAVVEYVYMLYISLYKRHIQSTSKLSLDRCIFVSTTPQPSLSPLRTAYHVVITEGY
jgi:hypothetical protein